MNLLPNTIFQDRKIFGHYFSFFLVAILIFFIKGSFAQTTGFLYFGKDQGLAHNQVTSIVQDNDGALYAGTMAGLSKFDGNRFVSFGKNEGLAEQWVTSLLKDKKGNIWIGHWAGGISRLNKQTNNFENLQTQNLFNYKSVLKIKEDSSGKIWFAVESFGLFYFEHESKKIVQLKQSVGKNISDFVIFGDHIIASSDHGLYFFTDALDRQKAKTKIFNLRNGLLTERLTSLALDRDSILWIGSADGGLTAIETKAFSETNIFRKQILFTETQLLPSIFIREIYITPSGETWIGTVGGGAALFVEGPGKTKKEKIYSGKFKIFNTQQGLNYFNVNAIFQDKEGSVWIATDLGLNQYRGSFFQIFDEQDGLNSSLIWSVFVDQLNNVWLGTNTGICKIILSKNEFIKSEVLCFSEKEGFPNIPFVSIYQDKNKRIWFGSAGQGLFLLKPNDKKPIRISVKEGLASEFINSIAEDKNGNIWCGTKEGLSKINFDLSEIVNFYSEDGLESNYVYRVFTDSKGTTWFGSLGGGLKRLENEKIIQPYGLKEFKERFILSITEDKKGKLWFSTYGSGIYSFDGASLKNYLSAKGSISAIPYSIVSDSKNGIWVGTSRGIESFDQSTGKFFLYGKEDGFLGEECNPGAIFLSQDSCLWLGTISGALKIDTRKSIRSNIIPQVKITGIKLHFRDTVFPIDNEFSASDNNLSFCFSATTLLFPNKIYYEYMLEGLDAAWIKTGIKEPIANYTNIPSGEYTFKVRSINSEGKYSRVETYHFTIKTPIWQRVLFYVFILIFFSFTVFAYDKFKERKRKNFEKEIHSLTNQRVRELEERNGVLVSQNKKLNDEISFGQHILSSVFSGENEIHSSAHRFFKILKAKEKMGGDFFWSRSEKNALTFAVVDCFGFGIPSSVLATYIYSQFNFRQSDFMAQGIERTVQEILNSGNSPETNRLLNASGILVVRLDYDTKQIHYVSKQIRLLLIRNGEILFCEKQEFQTPQEKTQEYKEGDILFVFTDGFVDFFGQSTLFADKIEKAIQFIVSKTELEFGELEKEINQFLLENEKHQEDDLCILAIKF